MQVETYEVTETGFDGEPIEMESEAIALIERLELEGQQKLIHRDDSGEQTRVPYRKMTADEKQVYEILFTEKTPICKYADDPIPVRVLQVAAHAVDLFDQVQVWHKPNADIDDPLLVGRNGEWSTAEFFMLARWGEALAPFVELRDIAARIYGEQILAKVGEIRGKLTAIESSVESTKGAAVLNIQEPGFYY